jgi:hypothetical protein
VASSQPQLPSYRPSVNLATDGATQSLLPLSLSAVATPLVLAALLRGLYGPTGQFAAAQALTSFATMAALTGCCAALASQGAVAALGAAASGPALERSDAPGTAGSFIEHSVGPAALLALKATVVSSVAIAPLLF